MTDWEHQERASWGLEEMRAEIHERLYGRKPMTDLERYEKAAHAMQCGVAMEMEQRPAATSPKHLRVGVNSAMVEHSALARLLIEKGIITDTEYIKALADGMENEVREYEARIKEHLGGETEITLH